ncbi:hypothetical protein Droror1_Dr00019065 [Drosera rotundifolia]
MHNSGSATDPKNPKLASLTAHDSVINMEKGLQNEIAVEETFSLERGHEVPRDGTKVISEAPTRTTLSSLKPGHFKPTVDPKGVDQKTKHNPEGSRIEKGHPGSMDPAETAEREAAVIILKHGMGRVRLATKKAIAATTQATNSGRKSTRHLMISTTGSSPSHSISTPIMASDDRYDHDPTTVAGTSVAGSSAALQNKKRTTTIFDIPSPLDRFRFYVPRRKRYCPVANVEVP